MAETPVFHEKLKQAFEDCKDDSLSLVTIIDMYAMQVNKEGTPEDQAMFLETILTNIKSDKHLLDQIGWDLPKILIRFVLVQNFDPQVPLLQNRIVATALKCFNEIALFGNSKECFLTGCELLGSLKLCPVELADGEEDGESDDVELPKAETNTPEIPLKVQEVQIEPQASVSSSFNHNRSPEEVPLEIKFHALLELVGTTLRRIDTCYPSKFLAMAVSAIFSFVRLNASFVDDSVFVLRRVYAFARNYMPPEPSPQSHKGMSSEELEKNLDDENALQRKLLRCLLTFSLGQMTRPKNMNIAIEYFFKLKGDFSQRLDYEQRVFLKNVISRFYQLALSFDIDIKESFLDLCVKESRAIYKSLPPDSEIVNEAAKNGITQLVYRLAYSYELQKKINEKNLSLDPNGLLVLATYHYQETGKILCPELKIDDAIYMFLRFITPEMCGLSPKNLYTADCCNFWLWSAVTNSSCKDNKLMLQKIPSYLNMTFLQILLLRSFHEPQEQVRMISFTLLTRVLCLMPENTSFEFAKDTLLSCPFNDLKCCILGILKDLMLNNSSREDITTKLSNLNISNASEKKPAPPLPARSFININDDRMAAIHSLAMMSFEDSKVNADKSCLRLLLTYLNFFTGLRFKWDRYLLEEFNKQVSEFLSSVKSEDTPEYGFIEIAHGNLTSFLSQ
ncbi:LAQU0S02e09868g1_1 [Lachancea quebecensis]|uniref:LAQU0S02e09868g1_1 n=1 Tax=Lachancea quebecensis TaxID=1654605 RepID=A0A0P1KN60_9SACH|nr:LAQU0S02e09868g1_1 [Lachancea quebecensis]